jgi:hypothetical protein
MVRYTVIVVTPNKSNLVFESNPTTSGIGGLLSSAIHLSNMEAAALRFLVFTELIISGKSEATVDSNEANYRLH